jgi:hypothetical protein
MAINVRAVKYTADNGAEYNTGMDAFILAQVNGGGAPLVGVGALVAGDGALPPFPRGFHPRTATLANAANGKSRTVVCLTPTSDLYTETVTALNIHDGAGASAVYTLVKTNGERKGRVRHIDVP